MNANSYAILTRNEKILDGFLILLLAGLLAWTVLLFPGPAAPWSMKLLWGVSLIQVVLTSIMGVAWPWRRKRAGEVVLDLGRIQTGLARWLGPFFFLSALMVVALDWTRNFSVDDLVGGPFWLAVGIYYSSLNWHRMLITERGLFVTALAEWKRFETWTWEGKDGNMLKLFPKENPDSFWWGLGYRRLPLKMEVPAEMKEAMTGILAARLSSSSGRNVEAEK